jgi:Ni/Co efflux regulator RcnB
MKMLMIAALAASTALTGALPAGAAFAADQPSRYDHDRRGHDWDRDHRGNHRWHYYGGRYGYRGYHGHWRTGQRFNHWRDNAYVVSDYRAYNLPPPRRGYRYYRDDNGDIVMAAVATGIIGLIAGAALADHR